MLATTKSANKYGEMIKKKHVKFAHRGKFSNSGKVKRSCHDINIRSTDEPQCLRYQSD